VAALDGQHINAYARAAGFSDISASHPGSGGSIWTFGLPSPGEYNQTDSPSIIATAIAFAESGGDPSRVQQGQAAAKTGWGLWQITPGDATLLDPAKNAAAAYAKYKAAGSAFTPWVTFNNGKYKQFMNQAPVGQENTVNLDPASQALGGDQSQSIAGSVVNGASGFLGPVVGFLGNLTDVKLWRSLGWILLGIVLLILGLVLWLRRSVENTVGAVV